MRHQQSKIASIPSAKLRQLAGELGRIIDAGAGDAAEEPIIEYARALERQLLAELSRREETAKEINERSWHLGLEPGARS